MTRLVKLLCLGLCVAFVSCSGSTMPLVRDYTSGTAPHHVNPQSVIGLCPPDQPDCVGGGGGGGGGCVTCGGDPLQYVSCPGPTSCTTSTPYTVGQPVSCVNKYGSFTTGTCGGSPGSGQGYAVFWVPNNTCYVYLPTGEDSCFAATNSSRPYSSGNLTIKYCWYSPQNQTQHYFSVPASPNGTTALGTYSDTNKTVGLGFEQIVASYTQYGMAWGGSAGISIGTAGAIPTSTSNVDLFANGSLNPLSAPHYSGWASVTNTSGNCLGAFPNG